MLRPNLSISSSNRHRATRLRGVLMTCAWMLLCLIVLDMVIGRAFVIPSDTRSKPGAMAQYFNYGRSIDGKIARMIGRDEAHSAPILEAGWIDRDCRHVAAPSSAPRRGLTIYGMSFTNHIADQLQQLDPRFTITRYAGPAASPNHSYACFQTVQRTGPDPNRVQVLGVLASSLPRMLSLTGASTTFEAPQPFTFPRYEIDSRGGLFAIEPAVRSPADVRNPTKWAAFEAQLDQQDAFYDPVQYGGQWADKSVFLSLLRRAYAQAEMRRRSARLINDGAQYRADLGPPLRAMLVSFARQVRARGQRPVVILLQDRGYGTDSLARLVGPSLKQAGATVIRSDQVASVTDPRNFLPDGHFTPNVDRLIAQQLLLALNDSSAERAIPQVFPLPVQRAKAR
jgi:hypothetical protein